MNTENVKQQMRKGVLELCVLSIIAAHDEIYPATIKEQLKLVGIEVVGEVRVGDIPQPDGGRKAGDVHVLFQHVPDLGGIASVIEALILGDGLCGEA